MSRDELLREAERQLTVCNACRYCEGYCAVFPALERRHFFLEGDISYLANLCHDCRDCYDACMYTPPHEFAINFPLIMSQVRVDTYQRYTWPSSVSGLLKHGKLGAVIITGVSIWIALLVASLLGDPARLLTTHTGPGSFYQIFPYVTLVAPAMIISLYALVVFGRGAWRFWRETRSPLRRLVSLDALRSAGAEALSLRWLRGGGAGCYYQDKRGSYLRVVLHSLVFWGFVAAFVATAIAAFEQEVLHILPPYPALSLPVILGSAGGLAMIAGTTGFLLAKPSANKTLAADAMTSLDYAFLIVLDLASVTGMLTLLFRSTPAMGLLLVLHVGVLGGLYLTAPYSKFAHFVYRYAALIQNQLEEKRTQ